MKSLFALMAAALLAMPAAAGSFTIKFEMGGEHIATWTYDDDGTATSSTGETVDYTFDEASSTFTATAASGEQLSATFEDFQKTIGHTMAFEGGDGSVGVATVIDVKSD